MILNINNVEIFVSFIFFYYADSPYSFTAKYPSIKLCLPSYQVIR